MRRPTLIDTSIASPSTFDRLLTRHCAGASRVSNAKRRSTSTSRTANTLSPISATTSFFRHDPDTHVRRSHAARARQHRRHTVAVIASMLSMPSTTSPVSSDWRLGRHRRRTHRGSASSPTDRPRSGHSPEARSPAARPAPACSTSRPLGGVGVVAGGGVAKVGHDPVHVARLRFLGELPPHVFSTTSPTRRACRQIRPRRARMVCTPLGWIAERMISGSAATGISTMSLPSMPLHGRWLPAATETEIEARTAL